MTRHIPDEVYEIINNKEHFPEGTTIKVRHNYDDDGNVCSVHKSRALAITHKDGGWTWFCHRCGNKGGIKEFKMSASQVLEHIKERQSKVPLPEGCQLPEDVVPITKNDINSGTRRCAWDALTWLLKYDMANYLDKYQFFWSPSLGRVITPITSSYWTVPDFTKRSLIGWIGRDPHERTKEERREKGIVKYLIRKSGTERPIYSAIPVLATEFCPVVITEDVISAIRVAGAMNCIAFAILCTDVPRSLLDRIGNRREVILWLDNDMTAKMIQETSRLRSLGYNLRYMSTQKDPKCYNDFGIQHVLKYILKSESTGVHM